MKYDFDKKVNRYGTNSVKWDGSRKVYGEKDIIPMWVADMDYEVADEIIEDIKNSLEKRVLGYTFIGDSYYEAVISWYKKIHNWDIKREWISFSPGIVPGLNLLVGALTEAGDNVIIQTPVYHKFPLVIENNGCNVLENPLRMVDGNYEMDFENLESIITEKTKLIILCNPHNPVGRVWKDGELKRLGEICLKNNINVISDEIHGDIVYRPNRHRVFTMIDKRFEENTIICTAPNKTFNIAGLKTGNMIIPNKELRDKYNKACEGQFISGPTIFGGIAQESAYKKGEDWYWQMLSYLEGNIDYAVNYFKERIPEIKTYKPEGTYLLWLDCRGLNLNAEDVSSFFREKCGVLLNEGETFSKEYRGYQRMNLATSRQLLEEALARIENGLGAIR